MLTDLSLKRSCTTLQSQSKLFCNCANYNSERLTYKLEQILASLYEEAAAKGREVEELKQSYECKIKEKDEIIERVTFANAKLVDQNQMFNQLLKLQKRKKQKNQMQFANAQRIYQTKLQQMQFIKVYLQNKNQELRSHIVAMQPHILKQQHTIKKSCTPPTLRMFEPMRYSGCSSLRFVQETENLRHNLYDDKFQIIKEHYLNPEKLSLASKSRRSSMTNQKKLKSARNSMANSDKLEIPITKQKK